MTTLWVAIFLLMCTHKPTPGGAFANSNCNDDYGKIWKASWSTDPRKDMRCHSSCNSQDLQTLPDEERRTNYDKCCTCNSCAVWEGHEIELFIEFVSVFGRSLVVAIQAPSENDVYKIEQENSIMTEIPSNLCNWDKESGLKARYPNDFSIMQAYMERIVKMNFRDNKISKLPDIRCIVKLDELNLKNNKLTFISNSSFTNMDHLRTVDLSGNLIQNMDPNIFTSKNLRSLFHVDLHNNQLRNLDISNMISLYPFCHIDYSKNQITELVNTANFSFNLSLTYGPGFVSLKENQISKFPDFVQLLKLDDITQLGHLFSFGFDLMDIPLKCDCYIEEFMERAYEIVNTVWRDYMNITCKEPKKLAGQPVVTIPPEKLICDTDIGCDPRCTCIDQPFKNTSFIDCSNSGLKRLPDIPPSRYSYFLSLNVSNNDISVIENVPYLHKISMLDISENDLKEINNTIANRLENATYIDISNNPKLKQLPQMFQYHNVCSRHMKNLQISCDCQSKWIEKWVQSRSCNEFQNNLFQCEIPNIGIRRALDFNPEDLECSPEGFLFFLETIIAGVILTLVLIGIVVYTFPYELLILCLRMRQKSRNTVVPLNEYDVFLSFNDANDDVDRWVNSILEPELTNAGYSVFRPNRDVAFGAERDSEIIDILSKTRNFLTIMSESYIQESEDGMRSWTENEWKYGWNNFKSDRSKYIVLVNFDHLSSFDVNKPQIKAFLRVGCTVDFKNHDRKIMQEIFEKLGPSLRKSFPSKAMENNLPRFSHFDIFTIPNKTTYTTNDWNQETYGDVELINPIFTNFEKNKDDDISNSIDVSKHVKYHHNNKYTKTQLKKCEYRKCYACRYGNNDTQNIPNLPKIRREVTMKSASSRSMKET